MHREHLLTCGECGEGRRGVEGVRVGGTVAVVNTRDF